jgi:accessory colonization factor AcfC
MEDIFSDKFSHLEHRKYFYTNIFAVTRFSIAREFKKEKVIEMWVKWVEWYESYKPDEISQKEEIVRKIHTSGKYRFCGVDKTGCPVLVIRMKYHVKGLATAK